MIGNRPMLAPEQGHRRVAMFRRAAWLGLIGMWAVSGAALAVPGYDGIAGFTQSALEIRTSKGRHWFSISIADTTDRQMQGLMFVEHLPADRAMLFSQQQPRLMDMWMKNTLIPLDMLFIDASGRVVCLRERAVPRSEVHITCDKPVKAVLEIGGGEARRRGIAVGDTVVHSTFGKQTSAAKQARGELQ